MSVIVLGMEMPATCGKCRIKNAIECNRWKLVRSVVLDRHRDCPLVHVPPHGDLIDRDELWVKINKICDRRDAGIITDLTCLQQILSEVRHAPTIIPAEPAEEGET